jgi:uncharacterized protein (DUF1778 family)
MPKKQPAKKTHVASRRPKQTEDPHTKPGWAYYTLDELAVIDEAAKIKRMSRSAFIADASITEAYVTIRQRNRMLGEDSKGRGGR